MSDGSPDLNVSVSAKAEVLIGFTEVKVVILVHCEASNYILAAESASDANSANFRLEIPWIDLCEKRSIPGQLLKKLYLLRKRDYNLMYPFSYEVPWKPFAANEHVYSRTQ